ncbi:tRNA adenosine deaminase-associated protein [Bailinhaonella thermotolerans]|uniref:tRNA adenosine deaminase-associated protein n=1 Tax=Bailinhaonella thermotolerans TaxID=1070861 RepID=A0A3A4AU03_9ACTN|nr:tRNA adenosine deaminase-associated protein [Bailinhaonella thermotolerans]RJL32099.1 hypothetical protein D5H75_16910 [Bailinhaonella thermotolerans]
MTTSYSRPGQSHYFAAVFSRADKDWRGAEVDLTGAGNIDDLIDAAHDAAEGDELALLCVEAEDEWFGIVRMEGVGDPRVFLSDARAGSLDPVGELFRELAGLPPEAETDLGVHPAGDLELLEDLGIGSDELLELSMEEGVLPAETLMVIAERLNFADELDRLR